MIRTLFVCLLLVCASRAAFAQPLGTFRWQLQPYCNVVSLNVTQTGSVYTLDGFDDQCGAATVAPLTGTAVPNQDGTIELGLNIVASPGGAPVHVAVPLSIATLGGTWRDSTDNTGSFVFTPGASIGGNPRPVRAGGIPPRQRHLYLDCATRGGKFTGGHVASTAAHRRQLFRRAVYARCRRGRCRRLRRCRCRCWSECRGGLVRRLRIVVEHDPEWGVQV